MAFRERTETVKRVGDAPFAKLPLSILVDGKSASASEIVAGTLSREGRARLIGERTFGKGIKQRNHELADGSSLKLTDSVIELTDGAGNHGLRYHGQGLTPAHSTYKAESKFPLAKDAVLKMGVSLLGK
jgi:C-terminal processing protease CtpA/Prc